jgi:hypothetical protein
MVIVLCIESTLVYQLQCCACAVALVRHGKKEKKWGRERFFYGTLLKRGKIIETPDQG